MDGWLAKSLCGLRLGSCWQPEPKDRDFGLTSVAPTSPGCRHRSSRPQTIEEDPGSEELGTKSVQTETIHDQAVRVFHVPLLVRAVGSTLGFCAGMVNAVALYELGVFVSHHTGTWTNLGFGIADPEHFEAMDHAKVLLSFVGGSALCGVFIAKDTVHIGLALYDFGLLSVSGLLIAATLNHHTKAAVYCAAAACGAQNGMATFWGGTVLRTTHVTGLFTDVGLGIGRLVSLFLRKRCGRRFDQIDRVEVADDLSKLSLLLGIAFCFLVGVCVGAELHNSVHEYAFLMPAGIVGTLGIAYMIHRVCYLQQKFFSDAEMEVVDMPAEVFRERSRSLENIHYQGTSGLRYMRTQSVASVSNTSETHPEQVEDGPPADVSLLRAGTSLEFVSVSRKYALEQANALTPERSLQ